MKKYYRIADVLLELEGEEKLIGELMNGFEIEEAVGADRVRIVIEPGEVKSSLEEHLLQTDELTIYETDKEYLMRYHSSDAVNGCIVEKKEESATIFVKKTEGNVEDINGDMVICYTDADGQAVAEWAKADFHLAEKV